MILGNDVSKWQGDIDWDVYKDNSDFVIIKASEGYGFADPKFPSNQFEARRVGLPLGYYHFARPSLGNTGPLEAGWFLQTIDELRNGEFLCLDYEDKWTGDVVSWCKDWLDYVLDRTKIHAWIYLNQSLATKYNWQPVVDGNYGLWIAAYTHDPNKNTFKTGKWPSAVCQQWTNKQQVPGIEGDVDGNVFFGDVSTLRKYGYRQSLPEPPPTPDLELHQKIDKLTEEIATLEGTIKTNSNKIDDLSTKLSEVKRSTDDLYQDREIITKVKEEVTSLEGRVKESIAKQTSIETTLKLEIRQATDLIEDRSKESNQKFVDVYDRLEALENRPIPVGDKVQILVKLGSLVLGKFRRGR